VDGDRRRQGLLIEEDGVDGVTFQVVSLTMQFNLFTETGPDGRETDVLLPPDITLKVSPGIPHEHHLAHCPKGDTPVFDANLWLLSWATLHRSRIDGSGVYTFTQLETTGGTSPWAEATFNLTSGIVHQHLELKLDTRRARRRPARGSTVQLLPTRSGQRTATDFALPRSARPPTTARTVTIRCVAPLLTGK
jgi:hypothetical protein